MNTRVIICGINTATLPKLTAKESQEYLERIKKGDKKAREEFIVASMRLVLSVVKKYNTTEASADDLFQAGVIGLIKAVNNFDLDYGVCFATYSVPMIIGEVKRFLRSRNSLRVPRSVRDTAYKVLQARSAIERSDKVATLDEIAKSLDICEREVVYALDAISDTVSIYDPVYNKSGDTLLLLDQIADESNTDERWTENAALNSAIRELGDRERKILYLRYYEGKTQTEISSEIGLSQAQVSRLEKNALSRIKNRIC